MHPKSPCPCFHAMASCLHHVVLTSSSWLLLQCQRGAGGEGSVARAWMARMLERAECGSGQRQRAHTPRVAKKASGSYSFPLPLESSSPRERTKMSFFFVFSGFFPFFRPGHALDPSMEGGCHAPGTALITQRIRIWKVVITSIFYDQCNLRSYYMYFVSFLHPYTCCRTIICIFLKVVLLLGQIFSDRRMAKYLPF